MLLSRHPLMSAALAVLISASAALSIPSPPTKNILSDPLKIANSSLEPTPEYLQNLKFIPWPAQPYEIPIYPRFGFPHLIIVRASRFQGTRSVSVPGLQGFLQEFGDNLEREYPIPGFAPRMAQQNTIDIQSYTTWMIEMNEGIFGHGLRTEIALVALEEIARQLGSHGPSTLFFTITEGIATLSYGFLDIREFGGVSLNWSLVDGNSVFQTA